MRRRINHRQLEAFQAVLEAGSVTVAAERLLITQPAVSRLIQDLERGLELTLFERRRGRLTPTVEARLLHEEVERSFTGLDRIAQAAESIRTLDSGNLRIAAMPALALGLLPRIVKQFSDLHPGVNISLQIRSSAKVMEWIASQQFDIGFAAVQHTHPAVRQTLLLEAPAVVVVPPDHRLRDKPVVEPRDLEGEAFVSLGNELNSRRRIDQVFDDAGITRRLSIDAQLSAAVCRIVAEGGGVSLVDPVAARDFSDRGEVACLAFRPTIAFRYSVLLPVYRSQSLLCEAFLTLVEEPLADYETLPAKD